MVMCVLLRVCAGVKFYRTYGPRCSRVCFICCGTCSRTGIGKADHR
jgi:hypothetical protein